MAIGNLVSKNKFLSWPMLITLGIIVIAGITLSVVTRAASPLVSDSFDGTDGIITSSKYYQAANFPSGGTSLSINPSSIWEGDSGTFSRQGNWGYSGKPSDWVNKYFFRFNTRNRSIGDAAVQWQYKSAAYGQDGYPVEGSDAVDVWLRYQTQYNLYVFQFDRTDTCFQAKRKIPAQGWSGPSNVVANSGVYYTLATDASQPIFGAGQHCITWQGVQNLLPAAEKAKPGFPGLAHDSSTVYDFKTTVKNLPDGSVQIQAYRAGVLVYSATDNGKSGIAADGRTQGDHIAAGYYNSVTGWQSSWGLPITASGATGFRADNIKFWLNDFSVSDLSLVSSTPTPTPTPTSTPIADTQSPTVSVTYPTAGSNVSGSVAINATASDNVAVTKVEYYVDNSIAGLSSGAPYQYNWDTTKVTNGAHVVVVKAYDGAGNIGSSTAVNVNVVNTTADTTPPSTPTSLVKADATANSISLKWSAATDNVGVASYKIYRYGNLVATANSIATAYTDSGLSSATSYTYTVSAKDAAGNESPQSSPLSITTSTIETGTNTTGVSSTFAITSSWSSGYCAAVTIKNTSTQPLNGWTTQITTAGRVTSLWNARWSQSGTNVSISNQAWNPVLTPGQTVSNVGFCAAR